MPSINIDYLTLLIIIALLVVALIALSTTIAYTARLQRLPAATKYDDVFEKLGLLQKEFDLKKNDLRAMEQKIAERDRYGAEAEVLKRQVDDLQNAMRNLDAAREEIEQVKAEAAAAAADRAELLDTLARLRAEEEDLGKRLDPKRIATLTSEIAVASHELDRLHGAIEPLRAERDAALRLLADAQLAEARRIDAETSLGALRDDLDLVRQRHGDLNEELSGLRFKRDAALQTIADAVRSQARLMEMEPEMKGLAADISRLQQERDIHSRAVTDLRSERDELRGEVARARDRLSDVAAELAAAEGTKDALAGKIATLETLRDQLESDVRGRPASGPATPEDRAALLKDLLQTPACLAAPARLRNEKRTEAEALHAVRTHLKASGLSFADRTLKAFHTSLKINDTSQLTVLAGVSGTGKSLLPRRYAEAMGIHFLQVAVEPRWDSPQDLLGFYNYVEKKYRATELARLLVHLDPWDSLELPESAPDRRDHMAILLLDEMNLARVEYYFSEFLSRLEARPAWAPDLSAEKAKDALIPVDIRGLDKPPMLFPAHNILFVGTMNDDESTQSLSDKVLDRGNILQFPAPREFQETRPLTAAADDEAQSFRAWRTWVRSPTELEGAVERRTKETIDELAKIMEAVNKPFGHRLNQSIRAYVTNYPVDGNAGADGQAPLADQIEFRILPKLRGIEIDTHNQDFEDLEGLVKNLGETELAEAISETRERQRQGSGLFVWRGLSRGV